MEFGKPSRADLNHRFSHHIPFGDQGSRYGEIRSKIEELAAFIVEKTPCSREQSLCLNALDQAMFLANASIARNEKPIS